MGSQWSHSSLCICLHLLVLATALRLCALLHSILSGHHPLLPKLWPNPRKIHCHQKNVLINYIKHDRAKDVNTKEIK